MERRASQRFYNLRKNYSEHFDEERAKEIAKWLGPEALVKLIELKLNSGEASQKEEANEALLELLVE